MATTRGVRMDEDTITQLQRLTRALGKTQAELLKRYIGRAYEAARNDKDYGPILQKIEEMEKREPKTAKPERKSRGAVIRLDEKEAVELRRRAFEQTGDPGLATHLAKEVIRERLLRDGEGGGTRPGA